MCDAEVSNTTTNCSREIFSSPYFKSSFAKSMVVEQAAKPVSYGIFRNENNIGQRISISGDKDCHENGNFNLRSSSSIRSFDRSRRHTDYKGKFSFSDRSSDSEKVDACSQGLKPVDQRQHQHQRQHQQLKLVMEECSPPRGSQQHLIDNVILQSRVDTLQWQLKQVQDSRQMYQSLMDQVMKFLERVYTNLDEISRTDQCNSLPTSTCNSPSHRVPRSRSALSMDATPSRSVTRGNRDTILNVSRARSTAQIGESPSVFCDYTWRKTSKVTPRSEVTIQKLSQDAYRLLRTVQSLVNTNDPNLSHNMGPDDSFSENQCDGSVARLSPDADSLQRSLQDLSLSRISSRHGGAGERSWNDSPVMVAGSFSSLRREHGRRRPPLHSMLTLPKESPPDVGLDPPDGRLVVPHYTASLGRPRKLKQKPVAPGPECYASDTLSEKQLSLSSNEDESGFSSMSSFQEVGLPPVPASSTPSPENPPSYPPVGVPVFDVGDSVANHRRWSSVPVSTHAHLGPVIPESVSVMWV